MNRIMRCNVATLIMFTALACLPALPAVAADPVPAKGVTSATKTEANVVKAKFQAAAQAEAAKASADLRRKRTLFQSKQKAQLDARNANARTELQRLAARAARIRTIRAEAAQLNARIAAADPAGIERIERRAGELLAELDALGY